MKKLGNALELGDIARYHGPLGQSLFRTVPTKLGMESFIVDRVRPELVQVVCAVDDAL